ncbi:MAG: hypothetical protein ACE5NC_02155 [Anaerolineae bacterium]
MESRLSLHLLRSNAWLLLASALAASALAVAVGLAQTEVYRASAALQVSPARIDWGLTQAAEKMLRQFALQVDTTERLLSAIDRLQLDVPPQRLEGAVTVASLKDQFLIQIDVDHPDPITAQELANTLAKEYVISHASRSLELDRRDRVDIGILELAPAGTLQWPQLPTLAGAGAVFGFILGGVLVFASARLGQGRLRTPEAAGAIGTTVLGAIPGESMARRARRARTAQEVLMELSAYARILLRRGWIPLLVGLVAAVGAFAFAKVAPATYRSGVILQAEPARFEAGMIFAAEQLLNQFANQIQTTDRAQGVIDSLSLPLTTERFLEEVEVIPIPEDFLIRVEVGLPDGDQAVQAANVLALEYVSYHAQAIVDIDPRDRVRISVLEPARRFWLHWPRARILAPAAGLLGAVLGGLLILGMEYFEAGVLRSSQDAERRLAVPVLGTIPAKSNPESGRRWPWARAG